MTALLLTPGTRPDKAGQGIFKPLMVSKRHDTDSRWRQLTKLPRPCPQYPPFTLGNGILWSSLRWIMAVPALTQRRSQALRVAARAFDIILMTDSRKRDMSHFCQPAGSLRARAWAACFQSPEGRARDCRLGIEKGDKFVFSYECPAGICPRVMTELFTWCEVIRCGGDFTYRGAKEKYEMDISCPCGSINFQLRAIPINRDEMGNTESNNSKSEG